MLSGGLDSAVLAAQEARTYVVHPVYVAGGLAWEEGEQRVVRQLLSRPPFSDAAYPVQPLARLEFNMRDVYPATHWALMGTPPAYDTPDEDVYLHGRNIALLSKAAVYAASRKVSRIVVAPLAGNPFPDATPQFFAALSAAFSLGLAAPIDIARAFRAPAQGRRGENWGSAGCPHRADALLHESIGHDALRFVQQVQGAEGRVSGGGHCGSDRLRKRESPLRQCRSRCRESRGAHRGCICAQRGQFDPDSVVNAGRHPARTLLTERFEQQIARRLQNAAQQHHFGIDHRGDVR